MLILRLRRPSTLRRVGKRGISASRERALTALRNAQASVEIEGFTFTEKDIQVLVDKSLGKLTRSQFIERAKEMARNV